MPSPFAHQPLFAPLAPLLAGLPGHGSLPSITGLNAIATERGIVSASAPLSFVMQGGSGLARNERIFWLGEVEMRPGNWRDYFNALVWLCFPLTKAALNARHHRTLATQQDVRHSRQGHKRSATATGAILDALIQFDECGVALVSSQIDLWDSICGRQWKEVFWIRRNEVQDKLRVFVFGHASYDMLRTPQLGPCGKAIFLHVDEAWLTQPYADQLADVDARMAQRFSSELYIPCPRDFQPLPLLGIPGATPDNEDSDYYENTRRLRPKVRLIPS